MILTEDLKLPVYIMYSNIDRNPWIEGPLTVVMRLNKAYNSNQKNKDVGKYVTYFDDISFLMGNGREVFSSHTWSRGYAPSFMFKTEDLSKPKDIIKAAFEGIKRIE